MTFPRPHLPIFSVTCSVQVQFWWGLEKKGWGRSIAFIPLKWKRRSLTIHFVAFYLFLFVRVRVLVLESLSRVDSCNPEPLLPDPVRGLDSVRYAYGLVLHPLRRSRGSTALGDLAR